MSAYVESIAAAGATSQKNTWMRRIRIVFESKEAIDTSDEKLKLLLESRFPGKTPNASGLRVVIGDNPGDNFNIHVQGTKNVALTKDNGTISISNVNYDTIALIQALKLYRVEIWVGYQNNDSLIRIAKGEISYISQKIHSRHDTTLYITYASELVAAWSQNRINFSARAGVNMYAMINSLFIQQGTDRVNVTDELRNVVRTETFRAYKTSASIIESCLNEASTGLYLDSDSSLTDKVVNVTTIKDKRVIKIDPNMINIGQGNPTVTSQGLDITLFPVIALVPGDILQIDNAMLDLTSGMTSAESVTKTFNTNYMDPNGCYMIRKIDYVFENRGNSFYYRCQAISPQVFGGITGASV